MPSDPQTRLSPSDFWDAKYDVDGYLYGEQPNAFLVDQAYRFTPGQRVLAVGDGEGRNGVWLAEQGPSVVSVDASPRALQKASRLALQRGVRLTTICADLTDWAWPERFYDGAFAIYVHFPSAHRRTIHRAVLAALKPGGHLVLEAFTPDQLGRGSGGPKSLDMLYTATALAEDFAAAEILELAETLTPLSEGNGHAGEAAVVRLVARRPVDP